jgi:hypothetical protein
MQEDKDMIGKIVWFKNGKSFKNKGYGYIHREYDVNNSILIMPFDEPPYPIAYTQSSRGEYWDWADAE